MARGSIEARAGKDGTISYRARIDVGRDALTGRRRYETDTFRTKRAAERWLTKTANALDEGTYIRPSSEPLGPYLSHWLATKQLAPRTRGRYEQEIRLHLTPALGSVALGKLTGRQVQALYNQHRGTSHPPIMQTILHQALDQALAEGLIARNPVIGLHPVGIDRAPGEQATWTIAQLSVFLAATEPHRYHALYVTLAATGLRLGEALALVWRDVDLVARTLVVGSQTRTKTRAGRRVVSVDAETAATLTAYRARQRERLREQDILVTSGTRVFDRGDGERPHPWTVESSMARIVGRLGLPPLTPHGLRHEHATLLLSAGRPLHYVQRRLGHHSSRTTLEYYAHVIPETASEDADLYGQLLREARARAS